MKIFILMVFSTLLFMSSACSTHKNNANSTTQSSEIAINKSPKLDLKKEILFTISSAKDSISHQIADTTFVNLKDFSTDFVYRMKYATTDNFLKTKVYDCEACYLRYKTVKSLIKANEKFIKKGYRIVLFDCYRPLDIQKKMWQIVPNPTYVADPKKGSIHNRGGAVDISLVDIKGNEVDMGTPFDFFGIEASHNFENLSDEILNNRKLLRKIMTHSDFKIFESEWWHYNLKGASKNKLSNFKWKCD